MLTGSFDESEFAGGFDNVLRSSALPINQCRVALREEGDATSTKHEVAIGDREIRGMAARTMSGIVSDNVEEVVQTRGSVVDCDHW